MTEPMTEPMTEIGKKLREYFARVAPGQEVAGDTPLLESGILDSLAVVKLLAFLEESFGVEIGDDEFDPDNFESLDAIEALIARKRQEAG